MPKRRRFVRASIIVGVISAVGLVCVAWMIVEFVTVGVPDMYAQWWVGDMVIEHMASHCGAWPRNWDDLREPYATCVRKVGNQPWSFDDLRDRVEIDFGADPKDLAKVSPPTGIKPPFRVIYLRNGKFRHWEGAEPNRMVWDYLTTDHVRP